MNFKRLQQVNCFWIYNYAFVVLLVVVPVGNTFASTTPEPISTFESMIESDTDFESAVEFVQKNVPKLPQDQATEIVLRLETFHRNKLHKLNKKFSAEAQIKIRKSMNIGIIGKIARLNKFNDVDLSKETMSLLKETRDKHALLHNNEGYQSLEINYDFYYQFYGHITPEIEEYFEIMDKETRKPPFEDGALLFSWDELIDRAVQHERFLKNYPNSPRLERIKSQLSSYIYNLFDLGSLSNSPLTPFGDDQLQPEIKSAFKWANHNNEDSGIVQKINKFMKLLKKSDYRMNQEAKEFLKKIKESSLEEIIRKGEENGDPGRI